MRVARIQMGLASAAVALVMTGAATAQVQITEFMYDGANGEFVELTNRGVAAVDMTGWSFDDNSNTPGSFSIGGFGVVAPGESVIIAQLSDAAFRTAWGLPITVKVVGGSTQGLGRDDEINIYDSGNNLVTRLTYGDQAFPGTIRTQTRSGWPCAEVVGQSPITVSWNLSAVADAQSSFTSTGNDTGSPGSYAHTACGPPPTGACCRSGLCTDETQTDCLAGSGLYQGDGTDCMTFSCPAPSNGVIRITEYMYSGSGAEFIEFTNLDVVPVDMTGWSFDDDSNLPGTVSLSAFGVVAPGESVILTDGDAAAFIAAWGLTGVQVIGGNTAGLGRNDQINLYDGSGALVDRLTYGDETFPGTIRTLGRSGWPCDTAVGNDLIAQWQLSALGDSQSSFVSSAGDTGNPGQFTLVPCNAIPTGACCSVGVCTDETATSCIQGGRAYQGDGTDCGSFACPAPNNGVVRITEYMYSGTGGEFIEFTNLGPNPVDMTGWSYDDDGNVPGTTSLSAFGVVMPGESVILTEDDAATFATEWNLSGVSIIGGNTNNLGRNDQINLYDGGGVLHDRLTYGDQTFPGTIRTQNFSGWPCDAAVGNNIIADWFLSALGDPQNSYASSNNDIGNPGTFVLQACAFCGNGRVDAGEDCDGGDCCTDQCVFADSSVECRPAADVCDAAEFCTGSDANCPGDVFQPQGTECRAATGDCDVAEACNGQSFACPPDAVVTQGVECRAAAGDCDESEVCDGVSRDCPADVVTGQGVECRASAGECDPAEACDGVSVDCPADELSTDECRASTGPCDPAESCDGSSAACPADVVITSCLPGDGCCPLGCNAVNDSDCAPFCGNTVVEPGEQCDDGNATNGDGCSDACQLEGPDVIPTTSTWGLLIFALLLAVVAKAQFGRRTAAI